MQKMIDQIMKTTAEERVKWDKLLQLEGQERMQLLLDTSTFECNKPIIMEMFSLLTGVDWSARMDTTSSRRQNISFQPGTMIQFNHLHDHHNYPVPSLGLITHTHLLNNGDAAGHGKEYMTATNEDGKLGSFLYVYNPWKPAFEPVSDLKSDDVKRWLQDAIAHSYSAIPAYTGTLKSQLRHATGEVI